MIQERRMFDYCLRVVRSSLDELEVARRANSLRIEMRPLTDRLLGDVADLRSALMHDVHAEWPTMDSAPLPPEQLDTRTEVYR